MIERYLPEKYREVAGQLLRYGVLGVFVTVCGQAMFTALDTFTRSPPQVCTAAGFLVSVTIGYNLHSRYTFTNQGERGWPAFLRFFVAALPSLFVNVFWTWLVISLLRLPHVAVNVPVFFVTPFMIFAINKWWVFK